MQFRFQGQCYPHDACLLPYYVQLFCCRDSRTDPLLACLVTVHIGPSKGIPSRLPPPKTSGKKKKKNSVNECVMCSGYKYVYFRIISLLRPLSMGQIANANRLITELQRSITISPLFIYLCLKKYCIFHSGNCELGSTRFCHCRLIFLEKCMISILCQPFVHFHTKNWQIYH